MFLRDGAAPGKPFHCIAIQIAALERHPPVHSGGVPAQNPFDDARRLDQFFPIQGSQRTEIGDRAGENTPAGLPLAIAVQRAAGGRALRLARASRDLRGRRAELLQQSQAQHGGQGPQLGQRQDTAALVGVDEVPHKGRIEFAVEAGHQSLRKW